MFGKILIANRGEIALRIVRACREMGIKTVAVYSRADQASPHVSFADEAICIGDSASAESYLKIPNIISAAEVADVDAIHPGYGFLSENSHFAEICESCNIRFIGPDHRVLELLGNKQKTRALAEGLGLPVIPGSNQVLETEAAALETARKIGYPVMIKAVAGGGGKGIRRAHNDVSLVSAFLNARAEAEAAFGDPGIYIEKMLTGPRHIEIQVLADRRRTCLHLGERDCTIQRKNQKLLEECPSPLVDPSLRNTLGRLAVRLVREVGYVGVGTVEFLLDQAGNFYFLEMNGRIQVEHPVTEVVTGIDLVKTQIRLAAGEKVPLLQRDVRFRGHALECRINAEDPFHGFTPSPGRVGTFHLPGGPGVRVDTHIYSGCTISPYYDSLMAKLVAYAEDRPTAIRTMERALAEFKIEGVKTTIPLHRRIVRHPAFLRGVYGTDFLDIHLGIGVG
jgi:acetyl-CoA carboxylase biotin carboxylase subunit